MIGELFCTNKTFFVEQSFTYLQMFTMCVPKLHDAIIHLILQKLSNPCRILI